MIDAVTLISLAVMLLVVVAVRSGKSEMRWAVAAFLRAERDKWIGTNALQDVFDVRVHKALLDLYDCGFVERREDTENQPVTHIGHPYVSYRWKGP